MIRADMYVPDAKNPEKSVRVEVPYQSLDWLMKQLEAQGMTQDKLRAMNQQAMLDIYNMSQQNAAQGAAALPAGQAGMMPPVLG